MPRYVILTQKAEGWSDPAPQALPHPQVYPSEPIKTGLVDQHGRDIWKIADEIGFLRMERETQ